MRGAPLLEPLRGGPLGGASWTCAPRRLFVFVGLSDHRRFFVLLVVFVFVVIIVIGVSRRHRAALAGDEAESTNQFSVRRWIMSGSYLVL